MPSSRRTLKAAKLSDEQNRQPDLRTATATSPDRAPSHPPRLYDDFAVRVLDIQQLSRIAVTSPSRQRFLTELTLDPPSATSGEAGMPLLDEDYLILSTMHSAKGQEWNAVSVLNVVDGCIPSDIATRNRAEIEEELRPAYTWRSPMPICWVT